METQPNAQFPFRNSTLAIAVKKYAKIDTKFFLVFFNFNGFLYFIPNILSGIVAIISNFFLSYFMNFSKNFKIFYLKLVLRNSEEKVSQKTYKNLYFSGFPPGNQRFFGKSQGRKSLSMQFLTSVKKSFTRRNVCS